MPVFEHVSRYPFPRSTVFAWHTRPGALTRLTPPGSATVVWGPTHGIEPGSELTLRISHPVVAALGPDVGRGGQRGPLGLTWRVRHVDLVANERMVDELASGPFRQWRHEHHFADGPAGSTVLTDRIEWELPRCLRAMEPMVDMQLEALFEFREEQLRDDLSLHEHLASAPRAVVVSGASGLIGRQVCALLTTGGHRVTRLVRTPSTAADAVVWNPAAGQVDAQALEGVDGAINLSGHSIGGRFSDRNKRAILLSRITSTATLARALASAAPSAALIQASAIGLYGARRPGALLSEDSRPGTGFLAEVVRAWEAAAGPAAQNGLRTAFLRTGIVLTEAGGALAPQIPLFSAFVGGRLADADAWMSWITLDDVARAYVHALLTPELEGPVNAVGPRPVTNQTFAVTLGRILHRPAAVPTPALGPRVLLGAEGYDQLINTDQRVSSRRLESSGFDFAQSNLADALRHVLLR